MVKCCIINLLAKNFLIEKLKRYTFLLSYIKLLEHIKGVVTKLQEFSNPAV